MQVLYGWGSEPASHARTFGAGMARYRSIGDSTPSRVTRRV